MTYTQLIIIVIFLGVMTIISLVTLIFTSNRLLNKYEELIYALYTINELQEEKEKLEEVLQTQETLLEAKNGSNN